MEKCEKWAMFRNESMISRFHAFTRHVRRPENPRICERCIVPTVKNAPKVGCHQCEGVQWFVVHARGNNYEWSRLSWCFEPLFISVHKYDTFQQDGASCHQTRAVRVWLDQNGIELLSPWPRNSPKLISIQNCWQILKCRVPAKNPTFRPEKRHQERLG